MSVGKGDAGIKEGLQEGLSAAESNTLGKIGGDADFYKIPLDFFNPGAVVPFDLYFYYQRQYIILKSKGAQWAADDTKKVASSSTLQLYGKFKSVREHHEYLHSQAKLVLSQAEVSTEKKAKVLSEISGPILEGLYKSPESSEAISSAAELAQSCIKYLNERGSLPELFKLSSESLTEHAHGLFTSAYSVAVGRRMGVVDQAQTFALGLGALLHDIGKTKIDPKILQKASELDDQEWLLMRQHPEIGEQILYHRQIVPALSRRIVLEHHERANGRGYPRGVRNIHTFSKIVAVVDCFNALTSNRPWAKAMSPFDALKFMINKMRSEFDPDVMSEFIAMLSK